MRGDGKSPRTIEGYADSVRQLAVLDVANDLISHNPRLTDRTLAPSDSAIQGELHLVQWTGLNDEASGIAEFVRRRLQLGACLPGQVLILAPRRPCYARGAARGQP